MGELDAKRPERARMLQRRKNAMDSEKVIKRDNEYVLHTYARNPIVLE